MHCVRRITDDLTWIGANDRRLALFESVYPIANGVSYNSYLLKDEKTVLLDTVDRAVSGLFLENLRFALGGRELDYLIISHMEPDHAATVAEVLRLYPGATVVANERTVKLLGQFFSMDLSGRLRVVAEGDTLETGAHTLSFVMAPMVHWPEVMVTFDQTTGTLFSADAFGAFGALGGALFADEAPFDMDEARRYYANIVGKYGVQVQSLLLKAASLDIRMICPLHGPLWRKDIRAFIDKYVLWATWQPEENGVLIAYTSVYGHTENAANMLAAELAERGVTNVRVYDASVTHASFLVAEAFRYSHIVFASTTYNAGVFVSMENLLNDIAAHNLQNRTVAFIENGSWAPTAARKMRRLLEGLPNMWFLEDTVTLLSSVNEAGREAVAALAEEIAGCMPQPAPVDHSASVEPNALFKLSYGLFVLTAREGDLDNGCIVNTVMQVTDQPKRISVTVNKQNLTCDMIRRTGAFNACVLSTSATMDIFRHFGFQSGRDARKFAPGQEPERAANGIAVVGEGVNACLSGKVFQEVDLGTHVQFFADVTEARVLSDAPSATYAYYFAHIKPGPPPAIEKKKGWVCRICGYVYEGDELPADFVCPLCKHGPEDFERLP